MSTGERKEREEEGAGAQKGGKRERRRGCISTGERKEGEEECA